MHRHFVAAIAIVATLLGLDARAQEAGVIMRDFSAVQRLRVVCSREHFGRLVDLIANRKSGAIESAVVTMQAQTVVVPYDQLRYDERAHMLRLTPCVDGEHDFVPFDVDALEERLLLSAFARSPLGLSGDARGAIRGVTLEMRRGLVAFVHATTQRERAGDGELHPVPWAALKFVPADEENPAAMLPSLGMMATELAKAPDLIAVVLEDPLYRARLYPFYRVAVPRFENEQ